jgi:hypothetical protein
VLARKWDREFESGLLQRRVSCELGRGSNVRRQGASWDQGNGRQLSCAVLDTGSEEVVVTDYPEIRA